MKLNEWIRVVALIVIIAVLTIALSGVFERKGSLNVWNDFYAQEKDSLDVVIIGSSLIACAVDPYALSAKTGLTTFNMGIPAEPVSVHAAQIHEIAKKQKPDLIIIETFRYVGSSRSDVDAVTFCLAGMKPSFTKFYTIAGLPIDEGRYNRLEILVPLLAHHSRWESLEANDFKPLESNIDECQWWNDWYKERVYQAEEFTPGIEDVSAMDPLLKRNLDSTIAMARENDVKLLFFNPPNPELKEEQYAAYNAMYQYLDEQGIDWLECNYYPEFISTIDTNADYCDYHHVNKSGMIKTTDFLAEYINNNYDFEGQFSEDLPQYKIYLETVNN